MVTLQLQLLIYILGRIRVRSLMVTLRISSSFIGHVPAICPASFHPAGKSRVQNNASRDPRSSIPGHCQISSYQGFSIVDLWKIGESFPGKNFPVKSTESLGLDVRRDEVGLILEILT